MCLTGRFGSGIVDGQQATGGDAERDEPMTTATKILDMFTDIDTNRIQPAAAASLAIECERHGAVVDAEWHGWNRYTFADHSDILISLGADGRPDGWKVV